MKAGRLHITVAFLNKSRPAFYNRKAVNRMREMKPVTQKDKDFFKSLLEHIGKDSLPVEPQVGLPPNTFLNADCMDYLPKCPDDYFQLAIVDPPYGIGDFIQGIGKNKKYVNWKVKWNEGIPSVKYFDELKRVSKNQIIWGANYYNCFADKGGAIIWNKLVTHPDMSKAEIASVSHYKKVEIISLEWNGFIKIESGKTIHPCQKPIALYKWILRNYAKAGDLILDTHVGSASSLIACKELGFDYVGFEIDKEYYEAASKRLDRAFRKYELEF